MQPQLIFRVHSAESNILKLMVKIYLEFTSINLPSAIPPLKGHLSKKKFLSTMWKAILEMVSGNGSGVRKDQDFPALYYSTHYVYQLCILHRVV